MKHVTLKSPCWWIEGRAVREGTLADLDRFIETTTRPTGIGYKYYVRPVPRSDEDGPVTREEADQYLADFLRDKGG